jgi:ribosomal protein L37E
MFSARQISSLQKIHALLPQPENKSGMAVICRHCYYVNENKFSFCTNCGYPLHNKLLEEAFQQRVRQRTNLLSKAETSVLVARTVLYVMASFLSMGIFFIFAESSRKYIIVIPALFLSGLFFFLALWSRKNPFSALLTAFIILIAFSGVNIFSSLMRSFTTVEGMTGMLICIAILFIVLKGVQGAYRMNLIKDELQINM